MSVRVQPGARRTGLVGRFGDLPKVALAAPPVDGAANDELVRFVSAELGVRARDVRVVTGLRSRTKRLSIQGASDAAVERLFGPSTDPTA